MHSTAVKDNNVDMVSNPIFDYRMSATRQAKIDRQVNMHGGINQRLKENCLSTKPNSYEAIQKAYKHGLISTSTKEVCCQINKDGNDGKHVWN
jgi:hypothetical protein